MYTCIERERGTYDNIHQWNGRNKSEENELSAKDSVVVVVVVKRKREEKRWWWSGEKTTRCWRDMTLHGRSLCVHIVVLLFYYLERIYSEKRVIVLLL